MSSCLEARHGHQPSQPETGSVQDDLGQGPRSTRFTFPQTNTPTRRHQEGRAANDIARSGPCDGFGTAGADVQDSVRRSACPFTRAQLHVDSALQTFSSPLTSLDGVTACLTCTVKRWDDTHVLTAHTPIRKISSRRCPSISGGAPNAAAEGSMRRYTHRQPLPSPVWVQPPSLLRATSGTAG